MRRTKAQRERLRKIREAMAKTPVVFAASVADAKPIKVRLRNIHMLRDDAGKHLDPLSREPR